MQSPSRDTIKYMNTKTTPKDFFLHVGATVALYVSVIALINLAFEIVNRLLPDQLNNYWSTSSIVWPISMLVVLVPVLYLLEWLIAKDVSKMLEKKDIWIRKWRIYLTLFLTGATIVGDVITLINTYLNGEISGRFLWKVLILFVVCSAVFKYYFFSVHESARWTKLVRKTVPWWGIILALVAIIGGFIIVGSPVQQRAVRFDQQRVSDLTNIQWQVINYWQRKQVLPMALSDLNDPISNFSVPTDPETGKAYEYLLNGTIGVKGASSTLSFELCANFSADSTVSTSPNVQFVPVMPASSITSIRNDSWTHSAGRVCFNRTIDPALYPPVSSPTVAK